MKLFVTLALFVLAPAAFGQNRDCEYTIKYDEFYPGKEKEVVHALEARLKNCDGKSPCLLDDETRITVDEQRRWIRMEVKSPSRLACQNLVEKSCKVVRRGLIKRKTVSGSFKGQPLASVTCDEKGMVSENVGSGSGVPNNPVGEPKAGD